MTPANAGRLVGVLLLAQGSVAPLVNFRLLAPLNSRGASYLTLAAPAASDIRVAVLLGLAIGAITVAVAITVWPLLGGGRSPLALWLLAASLVGFSVLAVENISILTMLSLSQAVAGAAATQDMAVASALAVQAARRWAHYTGLIVAGGTVFVLYLGVWRHALIPRALGLFGMLAALLHTTAVTLPLFGRPMMFALLIPLGLSHLALAVFLLLRGFREPASGSQSTTASERFAMV